MLSGYFLIFLITIGSVGLNVWLLKDRGSIKKELEDLKSENKKSTQN